MSDNTEENTISTDALGSSSYQTENRIFSATPKFDNDFIQKNFFPIKLSKADIQNLSADFEDQTIGGHREFREEIIDGRLAKVYEYKIKIAKYENEIIEITKPSGPNVAPPMLIVENNLIVPYSQSIVQNSKISLNSTPPPEPYKITQSAKRGRPRKYPVGEEPYKFKKRLSNNTFEMIPNYSQKTIPSRSPNSPFTFSMENRRSNHNDADSLEKINYILKDEPARSARSSEEMKDFDDYIMECLGKRSAEESDSENRRSDYGKWSKDLSNEYF